MTAAPRNPSFSALATEERGAILLLGLFMTVFLVAMLLYAMGIAESVLYRERLQDAADAGALSVAILRARGMNVIVLINMVMAALLAVVVALRVVELLATLAIVLMTVAAYFTGGATLAAVPPLKSVRTGANKAYEALRPQVEAALKMLHSTARAARAIVPVASQAGVLDTVVRHYSPPARFAFALPGRSTLPVESDEFSVLCGKAGGYVATVATLPLEGIGLGEVRSEVEDAVEGVVSVASQWFCGHGDGKPPSLERTVTVILPRLPGRAGCDEQLSDYSDHDATRERLACAQVERDEHDSEPDERGQCVVRCELGGPYDQRAQAAREQCRPGPGSPPEWAAPATHGPSGARQGGYWWQERTVAVTIERSDDDGGWREVARRPVGSTRLVKQRDSSKTHPCGSEDAKYAATYNSQVHPAPDDPTVLPVCVEPWEPPQLELHDTATVEVKEVLQVLRCSRREERRIEGAAGQDNRSVERAENMAPHRVERGVDLGAEDFHVRVVAVGALERLLAWSGAVKVAAWGRPLDEDVPLGPAGRVALAQAEYFYDGSEERGEWMWHMKWRARLVRFRPSQDSGATDANSSTKSPFQACAERAAALGAGGVDCNEVSTVERIEGLILH